MMARRQTAGGVARSFLAMLLAIVLAAFGAAEAQQPGTVPQGTGTSGTGTSGTAAPATGAQGAGAHGAPPMQGSSAQQGPVTTTTGADKSGPTQLEQKPSTPEKQQLAPENGGLTFLPELKPTDGVVNLAQQKGGDAQIAGDATAMREKAVLLDRAVAVINGEVILASDVREQLRFAVFEPYSVPGGEFTPMQAMQQIVNRTLLLEQMQEQQLAPPPTDSEVDEQIADLRKHIPACDGQSCETEAGWQRFLAARGFTEAYLHARWKERMQILDFVGVRFRTGIRITKPEIETYYKEKLVPAFQARKLTPPSLAQVTTRIDDVLLQQHVNVLLNDYLRSLKDAGSVQILDPQYNSLGNSPSSSAGGSGTDVVTPTSRNNGGEP
jgi:peptidyl-prolyl cis-trans isomerase SurA